MELICPSCKTRYLVPDDAIPGSGRQVTCTECHHEWQAVPSRAPSADPAEAPRTPVTAESSGFGTAPAGARPATHDAPGSEAERTISTAEMETAPSDAGRTAAERREDLVPDTQMPGTDGKEPPAGSETISRPIAPEASAASNPIRQQQLNEIRKMLAEVQSGHSRAGASARAARDASRPTEETAGTDDSPTSAKPRQDGSGVPLDTAKSSQKPEDAAPPQAEDRDSDAGADASKRHQKAEQQADPDLAEGDQDYVTPRRFLRTGLLVIVLIAAAMTALYLLQPQITSRLPSTAPALTKYIEMIDKLRAQIASDYEWVRGKITGEESKPAAPSPGNQTPAGRSIEPSGSSGAGNRQRSGGIAPATEREGPSASRAE